MKNMPIRELRNRPGAARRELDAEHEVVLTSNGRPMALMVSLNENSLDETLEIVRLVRGQMALRALRREARERGVDKLTVDDIDAVIEETRR
jgi:antitoxin (DNA-binding transcriptional repressor) of toxin-antitoxin stability system